MSETEGGATTNLITQYKDGEDGEYSYGKNRFIAQTFTLTDSFAIFRVLVKMRSLNVWKPHLCSIRATDPSGKPLSTNISSMGQNKIAELEWRAAKWIPATFRNFPLLPPGIYAIVLSSPYQVDWLQCNWRANTTTPAYAGGKAWLSHNAGIDWEEIPNHDFMFEVWGYTPPPEPPPPPVISNFATLAIAYAEEGTGLKITVTTDRLCHLYMRWTLTEPEVHSKILYRRGLAMHTDKRFCFVTYHENEQTEAGDTLTHTFIKPDWPICQTRYFYFLGTRAGEQLPSTSALFKLHRKEIHMIGPYYLILEDTYWNHYLNHYIRNQPYAAAHADPEATAVNVSGTRPVNHSKYDTNKYYIRRKPLYFDTSVLPPGAFITSAIMHQYGNYNVAGIDDIHLFLAPDLHDPPVVADYGYIRTLTENPIAILPKAGCEIPRNRHWYINSAGLNSINRTGITKWACRTLQEILAIPPVTSTGFGFVFLSDPTYLIITYWTE